MESKTLDASCDKLILTEEQTRCVLNAGQRSLIIEGKGKTGKSLVLMRMYAKLLENGSVGENNKIAFFESISELNQYVNSIYEELVADKEAPDMNLIDSKERVQTAEKALDKHKSQFGRHRFHSIDADLWLEEFDWIKGMNIDQDDIDGYLMLDHSERDKAIKMNPADRVIAFQIFSIYSEMLKDNNQVDALDQALYLFRHKELIPDSMKMSHVLLDDGQRLTTIQASILGLLSTGTVVVAVNGATADVSWGSKDLGDSVEIRRLTISQEPRVKETIEEKQEDPKEKAPIVDKKHSQEKRKYTIDTSKARSGSLFRQLREKGGTRVRLADGLNQEVEEQPKLDKAVYDKLIEEKTLSSFLEAFKMLRKCMITRKMDDQYKVLIERMVVLQESMEKYKEVYDPDIYDFCEYYVPEILRLTETYLEYVDAGLKWRILHDKETDIVSALEGLVIAINGKIDEIYMYASINLTAKAKAVESMMGQDGYVKPEYKI